MPDIGDLLNTAAPDVRSSPDLGALERRAGTLRRRQQVLRVAPAMAFVLVISALALTRSDRPDELQQTPATEGTVRPGPHGVLPTLRAPVPAPVASGTPRDAATPSAIADPSASTTGAPSEAPPSPRSAPSPTAYPAADSCRVDTTGLEVGDTRSCSFTATLDGGYRVRNTQPGNLTYRREDNYRVDVTRGGKTSTYGYNGDSNPRCGNDLIEPGDIVKVTVYWYEFNQHVADFEVAAGDGYDCFSAS